MGEFLKQLISQLSVIWQKLSLQQRIIISSLVGFMFIGLLGLVLWSGTSSTNGLNGLKMLYSNLAIEDISEITAQLEADGYKYDVRSNGTAIYLSGEDYYQAKMALAREGLPTSKGVGYELFDKTDFGATDFEQQIKAKRALEGELIRSIEGIKEIDQARVHIVFTEKSLFLEESAPAKASIILKIRSGRKLSKNQVAGITYLVSSAVEGLSSENVSIIDFNGRLISNPYQDDETAFMSSRNMELESSVAKELEKQAYSLIAGIVGAGNVSVKIAADLDFDQVESTLERFDPESKVVRSEERNETAVKNAPDGDRTNERSLSNYEIDKTVEHIIREVGSLKRLTISVAVNGKHESDEDGKSKFVPKSAEELANLESIVKNAVGYDITRGDRISVVSMEFSNQGEQTKLEEIETIKKNDNIFKIVNYVVLFLILLIAVVMLRSVATSMVDAMNPPLPEVEIPGSVEEHEEIVEVPENIARSNELLEKVEMMTENDPGNVSKIIKDWLNESPAKSE
jgi:flagellar M-ring protein FliF